ncbi:MAG TPA: O-antigen ligase family protein [Candidatus Saccharimonadales bacterium]|nr:O-antigen ligase family protein [Candidatus Saccharimonadales bacterium]
MTDTSAVHIPYIKRPFLLLKDIFTPLSFVERFLLVSWLLVIALMPFDALLTSWAGSVFGHTLVVKSWKEILIALDTLVGSLYLYRRKLFKSFYTDKIVLLIVAYTLLNLLLWAALHPAPKAAIASLLMNVRYLVFLPFGWLLLTFVERKKLARLTLYVVLGCAVIVGLFALLEMTVLPKNFLTHFGYGFGQTVVSPYTTLNNNQAVIRLQSTLRGPNPFGAYLVIVTLLLAMLWRKRRKFFLSVLFAVSLVLLYKSYSRSAALGMAAAVAVYLWLSISNQRVRQWIFGIGAVIIAAGVVAVLILLPHSNFLQANILHARKNQTNINSTTAHFNAVTTTVKAISHKPLGYGPGSYGPGSFYSKVPQIPENYYLDIAAETGVLGLLLFLAINVLVARRLWFQHRQLWPRALLAVFVGMFVINLVLEGWSDDPTALLWWGLAGLWTAPVFVASPNKKTRRSLNTSNRR